jgi:hypothetical protein
MEQNPSRQPHHPEQRKTNHIKPPYPKPQKKFTEYTTAATNTTQPQKK